jgi:hypothetical protein
VATQFLSKFEQSRSYVISNDLAETESASSATEGVRDGGCAKGILVATAFEAASGIGLYCIWHAYHIFR